MQICGRHAHFTLLEIRLDPQGGLDVVQLNMSSGLDYVDEAAIVAVTQSQPSPNPPAALVKDGTISFQFGFCLDAGKPPASRSN